MRCRDGQDGFTLVELLVTIAVTSIVLGGVVASMVTATRAETLASDSRDNLDSARVAVERVRELVRGSYGVCRDSTDDVLRLWRRDDDGDRRIDPDEITTFRLFDGQLTQTDADADDGTVPDGTPRMFGLSDDSSFSYFDRTGREVALPLHTAGDTVWSGVDCTSTEEQDGRGGIATVGLRLVGDRAPEGGAPSVLLDSQVTLRNAVSADGAILPNRTPIADFDFVCGPNWCDFVPTAHDEDGSIARYAWDFGDGSAVYETTSPLFFRHTYGTPGSYPVTLTVTDNGGASASITQTVSVRDGNAPPIATFVFSCAELVCTFDGSDAYDPDGSVVSYLWEFGDGNTSEDGAVVQHPYEEGGSYAVSLTVTDDAGDTGSDTRTVNPSAQSGSVRSDLSDVSRIASSSTRFFARVRIQLLYADGSPAAGVSVRGQFSGHGSALVSGPTNAQGYVELQADADYHMNSTVTFTLQNVDGNSLAPGSETSITLRWPG